MTRGRLAAASLALVLVLGACADDDDTAATEGTDESTTPPVDETTPSSTPTSADTSTPDGEPTFPPNDVAALKGIFDPLVEPLGLRLTRGAVVDRSDGYEFSETGSHLALYVEPIDESSYEVDDYVANIYDLMAVVTPEVFGPFSGIETYDICQEPYQEDDDRYEPFPVTQVEITRENAEAYGWESGDLSSFLVFLESTEGAKLVDEGIEDQPEYQAARADAGLE